MIGADTLGTILLAGRKHVMLIDGDGHSKRLPVNAEATRLYSEMGTTWSIVGDVVIVPDSDYASEA